MDLGESLKKNKFDSIPAKYDSVSRLGIVIKWRIAYSCCILRMKKE